MSNVNQKMLIIECKQRKNVIATNREHVHFQVEMVPGWDLVGFSAVSYAILVKYLP